MVQDFIEGYNGVFVRRSAIRQFRIFEQQQPRPVGLSTQIASGAVKVKSSGTGKWRVNVTTGAGKEGEWTTIHVAESKEAAHAWATEHILPI